MKKIRVEASWDTAENILHRILTQFKTPDIDLSDIEFVFDDSYDVIVFFNYPTILPREGADVYVMPHEPTFSGSHCKNFNPGVKVIGYEQHLYNVECIESPAHTFYGGRGPWVDPLEFWNYENISSFKSTKTKTISSSITDLKERQGENCLYPERFAIKNMLSILNFVDQYGGGASPKKQDALVDYKFNLAIENEYQKNWISEKFYDPMLTDTIPVYFGCKNIKDIHPEDGYVLLDTVSDINYVKETLLYINENADQIYEQKIGNLRKIKEKYFKQYNLLKKIINL